MSSPTKLRAINRAENFFNELDIQKVFFKVMYHKLFILSLTFGVFLLGCLYTINIPPRYTSSALIQVDNQLGSANNIQQMLGNIGTFGTGLQVSPADIEIALIKSRFILQSVVDKLRLNLSVSPYYFPLIGAKIAHSRGPLLAPPFLDLKRYAWGGEELELDKFELGEEYADEVFYIEAEADHRYKLFNKKNELLFEGKVGEIGKSDKLPDLSLAIGKLKANPGTYFKIRLRHSDEVLRELSLGLAINDLGEKSKTKTGVLQLSFQGRDPEFIASVLNTIIDFAIQRNIEKKSAEASKTLEFLNRQLPNVHKSLEKAETVLNVYRAKHGTIDISQEGKNMLMQLATIEQNIAELKLKKVELLQELTPQHPYVISLTRKQTQLQKEVIAFEKKIRSLPLTDQKALSLERDVKVKNQLYLLLLNKIQQLQVLKAGTLSDIRILSRATVPITPLPDHKVFILLSSFFFGLFLSLMILFIRDMFKKQITSVEDVEEQLAIPTFAIVPYSAKQSRFMQEMKRDKQYKKKSYLLAKCEPGDIAIEGIRGLRTLLQHALNERCNNVVSIMGASPNIGKSFLSVNLAQVLVDIDKRVLLIDSDMRRGKMHQYFNAKKSPGLSNVLNRSHTLEEVIKPIDQGFDFISAGEYPKNPSELLLTGEIQAMIKQFSNEYDLVIIDTPPILAVTDAIIVAKFSATNLLVVGYGKDQIEELEMAVKRVHKNGLDIQGLVFNTTEAIKADYMQYHYYYAYEQRSS